MQIYFLFISGIFVAHRSTEVQLARTSTTLKKINILHEKYSMYWRQTIVSIDSTHMLTTHLMTKALAHEKNVKMIIVTAENYQSIEIRLKLIHQLA